MLINDLAVTGSFTVNGLPVQFTTTGSLATTGSNSFTGSQSISGSLTTTGTITAQRLIVNVVSSSIVYSSGSNIFGNSLSNTQQLTGSVSITGSLTYNGASITTIGNVTAAAATGAGQVAFFNGANVITSVSGLYFDGVDKLGVGTTNPLTRIEVYNSSEDRHFSAIGASPSLNLYSTNTSPVYGGTFGLATLTNAYIQGAAAGDLVIVNRGSTSGSILFGIGASSGNEKMRLSTSGNLGLGTASPAAKLHVVGSESRFGGVASGFISVYNATGRSGYIQANGGTDLRVGSDTDPMTFYAGGSEWMRLTVSGQLGLSTTSPVFKLDATEAGSVISGTATIGSNMKGIRIYNSNTNTTNNAVGLWFSTGPHQAGIASFRATADTTWETTLAFYTHVDSTTNLNDATEKMRLTGNGNLGLGVTPSAYSLGKVVEVGTVGNSFWGLGTNSVQITSNYYYNGAYRYANNGAANRYDIGSSSGYHAWFNAPSGNAGDAITWTQAMTLTSTGLGIGTTSPSQKLDVNGSVNISSAGNLFVSATSGIFFNGNSSFATGIYNDNSGILRFATSGSDRMRLDTSGNLGLGVVPSAWGSPFTALQLGTYNQYIAGQTNAADMKLGTNHYYGSGNYRYGNSTDIASRYDIGQNGFSWNIAPSGTAGNAISFTQAMTLGTNSGLSIGTTTAAPSNGILTNGDIKNPYAVLRGDALEQWQGASDTAEISINYLGYNSTNTYFRNFSVYNGKSSKIFGIVGSTGAATFSSSVTAGGLFIGTSNGQVGDINSTNANGGYLTWSTSGTVIADLGTSQQIFGSGGNDTFGINGRGARALTFGTNNTERLRITSGGNVLVGNTTGTELLSVQGNVASITQNNSSNVGFIFYAGSTAKYIWQYQYTDNALRLYDYASGERMRITSGGNVGIGTTSPTQKLSVYDGAIAVQSSAAGGGEVWRLTIGSTSQMVMNLGGATGFLYGTVSSTSYGQFAIRDGYTNDYPAYTFINDTNTGISNAGGTADTLNFITGGSERLRISSGGDVGLGTTSPIGRFSVVGSAAGAGIFDVNTDATRVDIQSYNKPLAINRQGNSTSLNSGGGNVLIGTATDGASKVRIVGLPTSATGLSSGDIWNDGGTLKIV